MKKFFAGIAVLMCVAAVSAGFAQSQAISDVYSENLTQEGRYVYSYPSATSFIYETQREKYAGTSSLIVALDTKAYSGAAIGNYPIADLSEVKENGELSFWIKGNVGGEKLAISLIDADNSDGTKTETTVRLSPKYGTVTKDWQKISIPLKDFPAKGQYWDGSKVNPDEFDWYDFVEVKFAISPSDNRGKESFIVYIDNVEVVANTAAAVAAA